ncbi:MAG: biotin/lipoyl-binding protein [Bacteroidales bacterium]|nr:biotin/lipoyl-binding protein [Clostridium sp.]MCM1203100.1 biotin/lipoyl-binding protein [Bacteroidales bacterium]
MKNYRITVNGTAYDVAVEELGAGTVPAVPVQAAAPIQAAPVSAPAAPASAPAAGGAEGAVKIAAPMPGKILAIKANAGQAVKKGDVVMILEAMKMENEITAPQDGTIAGVNVAVGDSVESGDTLASLN